MRKIIVLSMLTLDGVIQAPGGPEEDTTGGFEYGGWVAPYWDDVIGKVMEKQLQPADLLLGRKTFDIFAGYWPQHGHIWPSVNEVNKYVLSSTLNSSDWDHSFFLKDVEGIRQLKHSEGRDLQVHGSSELVRLLLANDLVDELWLKIYPLVLGKGGRLFDETAVPAAFDLIDSAVTTKGVIIANYKRGGEVATGTVGE